jgi:hypothetical protein
MVVNIGVLGLVMGGPRLRTRKPSVSRLFGDAQSLGNLRPRPTLPQRSSHRSLFEMVGSSAQCHDGRQRIGCIGRIGQGLREPHAVNIS